MTDRFEFTFTDGYIGTVDKDTNYWRAQLYESRGNYASSGRPTRDDAIKAMIEFREERLRLNHFYEKLELEKQIRALQARVDQLCDPELLAAQDALDQAKSTAHIHSIGLDNYFTSGRRDEDADAIASAQAKLQDLRKSKGIAA